MCAGIALAWSDLPTDLIGRHGLHRRVHERGGEREIQFLYRDRLPRLPVWRDGRLQVVRWGNGRGQSRFLPGTGWTWLSTLQKGAGGSGAIPVDIPVTFGLERGVWFRIRQGIRGILVPDERDRRRLHDLRARHPLLSRHDPVPPHARPHRGEDLTMEACEGIGLGVRAVASLPWHRERPTVVRRLQDTSSVLSYFA